MPNANLHATEAAGDLEITLPDASSTVLRLTLLKGGKEPDVTGEIGPPDPGPQRILIDDISLGAGYSTRKRPGTYSHGRRVWTLDGETIMPSGLVTEVTLPSTGATKAAINASFEQGGNLFLAGGRYAYGIVAGTTISAGVQDLGSGFDARSACHLNGATYVGGTGGDLWKLTVGGVWSQSADAIRPLLIGAYWVIDGAGGWRMVGTNADNTAFLHVLLTDDPKVNADWNPASPTPIGEQTFPCRSLLNLDDTVFFVCTNGVMLADARGNNTRNITPHWNDLYDDNNGYFSLTYRHTGLVGHYLGLEQVYQTGPQQYRVRQIGPSTALNQVNKTPIFGRPTAGCLWGEWVFVSYFDGTNSWLMAGKEVSEGTWIWHGSLCDFAGEQTTRLHVSNLASATGSPRLWIMTKESDGTPHLYWQSLPKWATPLQDLENSGPHRFSTTFEFFYGSLNGEDDTARKTLAGWDLVSERLSTTTAVSVSANADRAGYETQMIATASPIASAGPDDASTSGHQIAVKLEGVGTTTAPPVVYALGVWTTVKRRQFTHRTYHAVFSWEPDQTNGTRTDDQPPGTQFAWLCALADTGADSDPFSMLDEFGDQWTAQILNGVTFSERQTVRAPNERSYYAIVATFTVRLIEQALLYDTGIEYDNGAVYPGSG